MDDFSFSAWHFTLGTVKRFPLMLPTLLLDPFDLLKRLSGDHYDVNPGTFWTWALFGVGLFIACVLSYRDAVRGVVPNAEVRRAIHDLEEREYISGTMRVCDYSWLFYALRDRVSGVGIDTRNYPASPLGGALEWRSVLSAFDQAGIVKSQHFHPDMAHAYQVWQSNELGGRVVRYLQRHRPAEPITLGEQAMRGYRLHGVRDFLNPKRRGGKQ